MYGLAGRVFQRDYPIFRDASRVTQRVPLTGMLKKQVLSACNDPSELKVKPSEVRVFSAREKELLIVKKVVDKMFYDAHVRQRNSHNNKVVRRGVSAYDYDTFK